MRGAISVFVGFVMVAGALCSSALAHDMQIDWTFLDMKAYTAIHVDEDPWAGLVTVNVTNNSDTPWGDFHFRIFSYNGSDVSQVDIVDAGPNSPTTDRTPFTYVVDNEAAGSTLDYYFYSDPVDIGESASFTLYTDNTARRVNFGVLMYPTPVPEPEVLSMICSGLAALLLIRRGHGKARTSGRRRNRQGDPGKTDEFQNS